MDDRPQARLDSAFLKIGPASPDRTGKSTAAKARHVSCEKRKGGRLTDGANSVWAGGIPGAGISHQRSPNL